MLSEGELTFSEMLQALVMDSGHLNYHLESLGELITHTTEGKYKLSSFGMASVKLMSGVEDKPPTQSRNQASMYAKAFSVVLAVILLIGSFYAINLTTFYGYQTSSVADIPLVLAPNQTFNYSISLMPSQVLNYVKAEPAAMEVYTSRLKSAVDEWTIFRINAMYNWNLSQEQIYHLHIVVTDSAGNELSAGQHDIVGINGSIGFRVVDVTKFGNHSLAITNIGKITVDTNVSFTVHEDQYRKPLFYYGATGLVAASAYIIALFTAWIWRMKKKGGSLQQTKQ